MIQHPRIPIVNLVVYSLCNGIGTPLLALLWALQHLDPDSVEVRIHTTFIYEIDPTANALNNALLTNANYPGQIQHCGSITEFARDVHQHAGLFVHASFIVLVLSGTPCKSISRGCVRTTRRRFGLHASPSNLWFAAHSGLVALQERLGDRLITFAENVIPGSTTDLHILDATAGIRTTMQVPPAQGASRQRYAWTNVRITSIIRSNHTDEDHDNHRLRLPPGWQYNSPTRPLPCLRAIFPRLFWQSANRDPTLPPHDISTVAQCLLFHEPTQNTRLPPLPVWAQQLGFTNVHIQCMTTVLPCMQTIMVHTHQGTSMNQNCGQETYCSNCSELLAALGEGWHLIVAQEHLLTLLCTYFQEPFTAPEFRFIQQVHYCHDQCHLARDHL